jgi:hypothetical protein
VYVRKVAGARAGQPVVELVDECGEAMADVAGFLRLLTVRDYSPNTVRAYAHDLQKLFLFLHGRGWTVEEFTPSRTVEFVEWLRARSSPRKAQQLDLALTANGGRLLSAKTCNRVLAAVSSFFEFLISVERYSGAENPVVSVTDLAAARVPGRSRPPLVTSRPQRPVRRALRVKTVGTREARQYPPYFLGSIVYYEEEGTTYVVDGQQRITTNHLMLIHLYRLLIDQGATGDARHVETLVRPDRGDQLFAIDIPRARPHVRGVDER